MHGSAGLYPGGGGGGGQAPPPENQFENGAKFLCLKVRRKQSPPLQFLACSCIRKALMFHKERNFQPPHAC